MCTSPKKSYTLFESLSHSNTIFFIFLALGYAVIFGQVTAIVQQAQKHSEKYHSLLDNIRSFQKLYRVPDHLSARILDYFMSTWALTKGVDTDEVRRNCCRRLVELQENARCLKHGDPVYNLDHSHGLILLLEYIKYQSAIHVTHSCTYL